MSRPSKPPTGATIEYLTPFDNLGRCRFAINWVEPGGNRRSQIFFADPEHYGFYQ